MTLSCERSGRAVAHSIEARANGPGRVPHSGILRLELERLRGALRFYAALLDSP